MGRAVGGGPRGGRLRVLSLQPHQDSTHTPHPTPHAPRPTPHSPLPPHDVCAPDARSDDCEADAEVQFDFSIPAALPPLTERNAVGREVLILKAKWPDAPLENPQVSPPSPPPSPPDAPQPPASPPHQPPPEPTTPPTRSSRCPVCGSLRLPGEAMCLDGGGLCTQVFCDDTLSETDVTEDTPVSPVLMQLSSP